MSGVGGEAPAIRGRKPAGARTAAVGARAARPSLRVISGGGSDVGHPRSRSRVPGAQRGSTERGGGGAGDKVPRWGRAEQD
jgi:hypothetical protein